jgi:hypothetical protein
LRVRDSRSRARAGSGRPGVVEERVAMGRRESRGDLHVRSQFEDRSGRARRTRRAGRGMLQAEGSGARVVMLERICGIRVIVFRPGSGVRPWLSRLDPGRQRCVRTGAVVPRVRGSAILLSGIACSAASSVLGRVVVVQHCCGRCGRLRANGAGGGTVKISSGNTQFYCYFSRARSDQRPNEYHQARMQAPAPRWSPLAGWWD